MSSSNNNSNNKHADDSNRPSFSGNSMPMNVNLSGMDEGANETSRRITFQPSFEPISSIQPPSLSTETRFVGSTKTQSIPTAPSIPKEAPKKGIWKLQTIPGLPEFHVLERTATFVPNAAPQDVSMRISEVLRERSIEATYDDEAAKATCLTSDGVEFRVRLFRGRAEFQHGVIVEVQRRFGTSHTFHQDCQAVLDAAQDKVPPPPPPVSGNALPLVSDSEDEVEPASAASSLAMVAKMLSQPGYDTNYLGLQILVSLTDSFKMGPTMARSVSADLLKLDDTNEIAGNVLSLILDKKSDDVFKLRSLAFQAVANAFQAVKGDVSPILKEQFRAILMEELRNADTTPRLALQAARIAEFLVPQYSDLHGALELALQTGKARHAALERQAQVCLDKYL